MARSYLKRGDSNCSWVVVMKLSTFGDKFFSTRGTINYESFGFSTDTIELLRRKGHTVKSRTSQGSISAIWIDHENGLLHGAADSRGFDAKAVGN